MEGREADRVTILSSASRSNLGKARNTYGWLDTRQRMGMEKAEDVDDEYTLGYKRKRYSTCSTEFLGADSACSFVAAT